MIVQEHFEIKGIDFIKTYSDAGRYVVGGVPHSNYTEACDPAEFGRTYVEGDLIPEYETTAEDKAEAYDILLGVSE